MFIANGRIFNDQGIGKTTCKNVSLVDYLLLTPNLFDVISDFDIIDFNPMFSDVHNRIHFSLSLPNRVIDNSEINFYTPGLLLSHTLSISETAFLLLTSFDKFI